MFKVFGTSAPRSVSGEAERCAIVVACPLFLAMTAALWLARVAVRAAFTRFIGRGLALSICPWPFLEKGKGVSVGGSASGVENEGTVAVIAATPGVGSAGGGPLSSFSLLLSSRRLALLALSRLLLPEC